MVGRFAPSPTGTLHLGSLRTALAAWMASRAAGARFVVRIEDLDHAADPDAVAAGQLADLAAVGIDWDGEVWWQRDRHERYHDALATLRRRDLVYPCFCSRAEIRRAVGAPHGTEYIYPGTCRQLPAAEQQRRAEQRRPAWRLRADATAEEHFDDLVVGAIAGCAHDVVLQRNDGTPAYNLAVVVDDADQGVTEVVRGADLLAITATHLTLHRALGLCPPRYGHVPMVLGADGQRLAKRDGAVTLADLASAGHDADAVGATLRRSLGVDTTAVPVWAGFELGAEARYGGAVALADLLSDLRRGSGGPTADRSSGADHTAGGVRG